MQKEMKLYIGKIFVPATIITIMAIAFLCLYTYNVSLRDEERMPDKINSIAMAFHDIVSDGVKSDVSMKNGITDWKNLGVCEHAPVAAFIWMPKDKNIKDRLVWKSEDFPEYVHSAAEKITLWKDWTSPGMKRVRRGIMQSDSLYFLWARINNSVYALAYESSPVPSESFQCEKIIGGSLFVVLLMLVLSKGAFEQLCNERKAKSDNESKTDFLNNCTHELKTPLAGIGLWVSMLIEGRIPDDIRRKHAYHMINSQNTRMIRLVNNLLDFARLEQKRRRYKYSVEDISKCVENNVDFHRMEFVKNGIDFEGCENCNASVDAEALDQIMTNLIGNAAKYAGDAGPVVVRVTQNAKTVQIDVIDSGPGISKEALPHVFDRFFRSEEAHNSKAGGLGLGLSISHSLARDMRCSLVVCNNPNRGCTFTLSIPKTLK